MEGADRGRHQYVQRRVDNIASLVVEVPFEVVTDALDQHLFLVAGSTYEASVLLKQHDRVVERLLFGGLVDEVVAGLEDSVVLDAVAKVLDLGGLQLFVFDKECETKIVELPPAVNGEVVGYPRPLFAELIDQCEVRPDRVQDVSQEHFVSLDVLPEQFVPADDQLYLFLDAHENGLCLDCLLHAQISQI